MNIDLEKAVAESSLDDVDETRPGADRVAGQIAHQ